MKIKNQFKRIYHLPKFEDLSPYWKNYFVENDRVIEENFWGSLSLLKNAEKYADPYIPQQKEMGYCFDEHLEKPAPFYRSVSWVFENIHRNLAEKILSPADVLWPARVFEAIENGSKHYLFVVIGEKPPKNSLEINLVPAFVFVTMLAQGLFPMGTAIREHTNQSLAEHDLAHYAGFISAPNYMRLVRRAFRKVYAKMQAIPRLKESLEHFDSVYSLRLYYMMEIFTLIPETKKEMLQNLLNINLEERVDLDSIVAFLEKKAKNPANLYQYLYRIYQQFNQIVNPVGGESRDILNRIRKFNRAHRLGIFYSQASNLDSKFNGSSIYSLYQNACAALENKRSTHPDFLAALREIHAPFIGTLVGTSQLTIEDWVMEAVEEFPNPQSKLYQYLCKSGMWNDSHLIYWAHQCPDFSRILTKKETGSGQS